VTVLPSNRDTLPLADDPPAGRGGTRWLRAAGAVAGVGAVLVLGRAAVLPMLAPSPAPVAGAPAAPDPAPLPPPPADPSIGPDSEGAPGGVATPPPPAASWGTEEDPDPGARVEVRHLPDGNLALRVREASPGTQVWLPGGVHLLITEGNQVRVLDPVPDGALSLEHTP
jgi:hypothetical protein